MVIFNHNIKLHLSWLNALFCTSECTRPVPVEATQCCQTCSQHPWRLISTKVWYCLLHDFGANCARDTVSKCRKTPKSVEFEGNIIFKVFYGSGHLNKNINGLGKPGLTCPYNNYWGSESVFLGTELITALEEVMLSVLSEFLLRSGDNRFREKKY